MPDFERDLQAIKEEVRARSDIVEVIGQYTRVSLPISPTIAT